jgi:hypothetical protein
MAYLNKKGLSMKLRPFLGKSVIIVAIAGFSGSVSAEQRTENTRVAGSGVVAAVA